MISREMEAMALELGELVAGAYLKEVLACDVVDYNVRLPTDQHEFDVVGLHFSSSKAVLCEVAMGAGFAASLRSNWTCDSAEARWPAGR